MSADLPGVSMTQGAELKPEPTANRMSLLGKDAEQALEYLGALQALNGRQPDVDPRGTLRSALMHAAIVVYARSFKRNHGGRGEANDRVDITRLAFSGDEAMMLVHRRVMETRDTMIAHSDWEESIDERAFERLAGLVREQAENLAFELERLR